MKILYITFGFLFLLLGIIGIFLPILPTVPFLLVASWCFAKGSKKFDRWFKSTSIYNKHLSTFEKNKSMPRNTKIKILAFTTIILLFIVYRYDIFAMRIAILTLIAIKYYVFIFVIKTEETKDKIKPDNN